MDQSIVIGGLRYEILTGRLKDYDELTVIAESKKAGVKTKIGDKGRLDAKHNRVIFEDHDEWFTYKKEHFAKVKIVQGYFKLRANWTMPTNNTMYDCEHCLKENISHEIKDTTKKGIGWIRVCSGCHRYDGPWTFYGED